MNCHEEEFVNAFVEPSRRERFLGFLSVPKNRQKFIDELYHLRSRFLDKRFMRPVRGSASLPDALCERLRKQGAPANCWAIGGRFDGEEVELLKGLRDSGDGFVLSCIPGKLAYLKSEDEELILQR